MSWYDLSLEELKNYKGNEKEPKDFDDFWKTTLNENKKNYKAKYTPHKTLLKLFNVWDVSFGGFLGHEIKGWYIAPKESNKPINCIIHYLSYGEGLDKPLNYLLFPSAGYSVFVMDIRGQGSECGSGGVTEDPIGSAPHSDGFLTMGILDKNTYYYRRVIIDGVKAIEAAKEHELTGNIIVNGTSQGGGIALAVSALSKDPILAMIDSPFLCDCKRACTTTDTLPYRELATYCRVHKNNVEKAFNTLSYFNGVFFAKRSKIDALFSVGLMDTICPPSTTFAAYNNYAGKKNICIYPFSGHEGGESEQEEKKLEFLNKLL